MKRTLAFSKRCTKELLRDPLSLIFGVGLPLVLLFLMNALRRSTGQDIFPIADFAPATAVFAQTFLSMFSGLLIAQDRGSAYLARLYASPLTAKDFILGYSLPLLPLALAQGAICLGASLMLGLSFSINLLWALLCMIPVSVLFIALGLLLGCLLKETQVGGIGSALVQVMAFTSGMWFDIRLIGGAFFAISRCLPFMYSVDLIRNAMSGSFSALPLNLAVVCAWSLALLALAVFVFRRRMKSDNG